MIILNLNDSFDAAEHRIEQCAGSLIVVNPVSVSQAHEDDISRKARKEADGDTTGLLV